MYSRNAMYPSAMQYLNTSPGSEVTVQSAASQNLWSTQGERAFIHTFQDKLDEVHFLFFITIIVIFC
jgi:hypothetical protein